MRVLPDGALAAKDTLRTGTKNIRVYCWLAEFRKFTLAGRIA